MRYAKRGKGAFPVSHIHTYSHMGTRENSQDERSSSFICVCAATALDIALDFHEERKK